MFEYRSVCDSILPMTCIARAFLLTGAVVLLACSAFAQKGVDTQTEKIKSEGNKVAPRNNDVTRTFDWGKGKTKTRGVLANPYKLTARRDMLISGILDTLKEQKVLLDDASSRLGDGIIVTQPFVFAKGSVVTQSGLSRYAVMDQSESAWTRAQYTLTIEVQPIDGTSNNVFVNAKVEGRTGSVMPEWITLESSGLAEDEFLAKLIEVITGVSPNPVPDPIP